MPTTPSRNSRVQTFSLRTALQGNPPLPLSLTCLMKATLVSKFAVLILRTLGLRQMMRVTLLANKKRKKAKMEKRSRLGLHMHTHDPRHQRERTLQVTRATRRLMTDIQHEKVSKRDTHNHNHVCLSVASPHIVIVQLQFLLQVRHLRPHTVHAVAQ